MDIKVKDVPHKGRFVGVNLVMRAVIAVLAIAIPQRPAPWRHMACLGAATTPARSAFQNLGPLILGNCASGVLAPSGIVTIRNATPACSNASLSRS